MHENFTPKIESAEEEKYIVSLEKIFHELPIAYKYFVIKEDWMLVLKGIKASTDLSFFGDTYDEKEFQNLKEAFKETGLIFSEIKTREGRSNIKLRSGFVYNPEMLKEQTANSEFAPPYDGKMDIDEYRQQAIEQGYDYNAIAGKIYSFPESAIKDFLQRKQYDKSIDSPQTKSNGSYGNETYLYYGDPKADTVKRERQKKEFFESLYSNPRFRAIVESDDMEKSENEWRQRLPM